MPRRWTVHSKWPQKQLRPSKPGILPDAIQDGQGAGLLVVPSWDGYRLARAVRYNYWTPSTDSSNAVVVVESTFDQFLARPQFRPLGRSSYLWTPNSDVPFVAPVEESTYPGWLTRLQFQPMGRTQFRFGVALDESVPVQAFEPIWLVRLPFVPLGRTQFRFQQPQDLDQPVDFEHPGFAVRIPFKPLGRSPYLINGAQDDSPFTPEPDTLAALFVRIPYRRLGRNPYLLHAARALDVVVDVEDGGSNLWVVPNWDGYRLARASRFYYWTPVQSEDAPPITNPVEPDWLITYRRRR